MSFANTASTAWTGTLNLAAWTPAMNGNTLQFGVDPTGLTSTQLAEIEFDGDPTTLGDAAITPTGFVTEVPEPSTVVLGLMGGLSVFWNIRRRVA